MKRVLSIARTATTSKATKESPRIGEQRPRALPTGCNQNDARRFANGVAREAWLCRKAQRFTGAALPDAREFPRLRELADVAVWCVRRKGVQLQPYDAPAFSCPTVRHDAEMFRHRDELWLWRAVEYGSNTRRAHLGLHIEVMGPMSQGARRLCVIPWSELYATAQS